MWLTGAIVTVLKSHRTPLRAVIAQLALLGFPWMTVVAAPVITTVEPNVGTTNDSIMIFGSGFTLGPGGPSVVTSVTFNDVPITSGSVISYNQINVLVPAGATTGRIKVYDVNTDVGISPDVFTVIGFEPYITSFNPISGKVSDPIVIKGVHFNLGDGTRIVTNVSFNGTTAPLLNLSTLGQVTANVPSGASSGPISVSTPYGTHVTSTNFYIAPVITGFSPPSAPPGATITVTGRNFLDTSKVQFESVPNGAPTNAMFTFNSNSNLSVVVPADARTGLIVVTAPAGTTTSVSNFVVEPTLASFSPAGGPAGTSVTLTGANLFAVNSVTFNDVAGTITGTNAAGTNLIVTVPSTTTGPIVVNTSAGSVTSAVPFYLPPQITGLNPTQGRAGTNVTISGVNLSGATNVTFSGVSAVFSNVSVSTINAVVPGGVLTGNVAVQTPGGTFIFTSQVFQIVPLITGFSPMSGFDGDLVVITGTNFAATAQVFFNNTPAVVTGANLTQITARVPTNAVTGPIKVSTIGGIDQSAANFTVVLPEIFLSIRATNGEAVIRWPTNPPGFRLQAITNLITNAIWLEAGGTTSLIGGELVFTNSSSATNRFFRLIR